MQHATQHAMQSFMTKRPIPLTDLTNPPLGGEWGEAAGPEDPLIYIS